MEDKAGGRSAPYYTEPLKTLRARRGQTPPERLEQVKADNQAERAVLKAVAAGPKTVPEIAVETGLGTQQTFWWIAALRKYNRVREDKKRGDYMAYVRTDQPSDTKKEAAS